MAEVQCPYLDVKDPSKVCDYKGIIELFNHHVLLWHTKTEAKKEVKQPRKTKRMETKPPKFMEKETREEFRRKQSEFLAYSKSDLLEGDEISDNLYLACDTPLKRRLLASSKIKGAIEKTETEVILSEMERICLPKLTMVVERQHFCRLEQEEDETINCFEDRVRSKARQCGFFKCKCEPYCKKCDYNREEDEIMTQLLCNMRDKDLQKELWRKEEAFNTLEKVLGAIRASEAATKNQTAAASQASGSAPSGSRNAQSKMKCFNGDKFRHGARNCPRRRYITL